MIDTSVKYFDSTMSGALSLPGQTGALINLLDGCLKDGFGSVTLDSLVVSSNVATGTVSGGHGFAMIGAGTLLTGPVIRIAGATPSELNGDWRLDSVANSTTFTFSTTGISNQTATGTITAKRAPAGWSKPYSGTNKAVYARTDIGTTAMVLRVNDAPEQYTQLIMYETMSDVDTGMGLTPTSSYLSVAKSSSADSNARSWRLVCDQAMMYLFTDPANNGEWSNGMAFGDPLNSDDSYRCLIMGSTIKDSYYYHPLMYQNTAVASWARSYTQVGATVPAVFYSHYKNTNIGNGGSPFPNPVFNGISIVPIECWESTMMARGTLPGIYAPVHAISSGLSGTYMTHFSGLESRQLLYQVTSYGGYQGAVCIDITGPWR